MSPADHHRCQTTLGQPATDELAVCLMRMFCMLGDEAREIARRPLPKP